MSSGSTLGFSPYSSYSEENDNIDERIDMNDNIDERIDMKMNDKFDERIDMKMNDKIDERIDMKMNDKIDERISISMNRSIYKKGHEEKQVTMTKEDGEKVSIEQFKYYIFAPGTMSLNKSKKYDDINNKLYKKLMKKYKNINEKIVVNKPVLNVETYNKWIEAQKIIQNVYLKPIEIPKSIKSSKPSAPVSLLIEDSHPPFSKQTYPLIDDSHPPFSKQMYPSTDVRSHPNPNPNLKSKLNDDCDYYEKK